MFTHLAVPVTSSKEAFINLELIKQVSYHFFFRFFFFLISHSFSIKSFILILLWVQVVESIVSFFSRVDFGTFWA